MRKILVFTMFLVLVSTCQASFFMDSEGGSVQGTGFFTAIKGFFTTSGCFPSWQSSSLCIANDTTIKVYTDANSCGSMAGFPADNGTFTGFCNYCTYKLDISALSECTGADNETYNASVFDSNWASCCQLTGLNSDCYVDDNQYINKTYYEELDCEEGFQMWQLAIILTMVGAAYMLFHFASAIEPGENTDETGNPAINWQQNLKTVLNMGALLMILAALGWCMVLLQVLNINEKLQDSLSLIFWVMCMFIVIILGYFIYAIFSNISQVITSNKKLKGGGWSKHNGKA